jgi:photosystem II stability/assembly factor-like uncharacterized protein
VARPGVALARSIVVIVPLPPTTAIAFVDGQHGWAGGQGGLLGTSDGRNFRVEVRAPIAGITALDRRRAWAITGDGFVLRTTDGLSWARLGAPHLFRVQFVAAQTGFGLTRDGVVVRSTDAGRSWAPLATRGLMQSECFVSSREGWVARAGSVWSTHDGGRTWVRSLLRQARERVPIPELGCRGQDVWIVFHEGAATGTEGYHVYRSLDGGSSWRAVLASPFQRRMPAISNYAGPFSVLGRGAAVFTGSCAPCGGFGTASVVRTTDGGASFRRSTPFHGYRPESVSFVDVSRGWLITGTHAGSAAAARLGVVWQTVDGGRKWRAVFRSPLLAP